MMLVGGGAKLRKNIAAKLPAMLGLITELGWAYQYEVSLQMNVQLHLWFLNDTFTFSACLLTAGNTELFFTAELK